MTGGITATNPSAITSVDRCAHCDGTVELECDALPGFWGYRTYNEYLCPHCRKQNHALTTGAINTVRRGPA